MPVIKNNQAHLLDDLKIFPSKIKGSDNSILIDGLYDIEKLSFVFDNKQNPGWVKKMF